MTTAEITQYLTLALSALALLGHAKGYFSSGEKDLIERVKAAETTLTAHNLRVQAVENEIQHLPRMATAHNLEITMERIAGRLDTLDERMKPIASTNARLQEFLLEQAKK